MILTKLPINKKTLLISAIALSLTLGGLALSGTLSRTQKSSKESSDFEQSADVVSALVSTDQANAHQDGFLVQTDDEGKHRQNVHYVALEDANLTPAQKEITQRQIENLANTGSTSGGVLAGAFKSATHAKMSYRFGRKQPLLFNMANMKEALPSGFVMTGRDYEGIRHEGGFDGVYRLFENPNNKAWFEITETYIHPDEPLTLIKELHREDINGTPLRFEQLTDKKGRTYYHAQFVADNRHISMTSRGMHLTEFMTVIHAILAQTNAS